MRALLDSSASSCVWPRNSPASFCLSSILRHWHNARQSRPQQVGVYLSFLGASDNRAQILLIWMRPAVSGPLGSFCAPGRLFSCTDDRPSAHIRETARTAFTVCKAVMMVRPSIQPSGPFPSARPNKSAQISIAHSADGKFHYGSSFILCARATTFFCELSDAYSSPCGARVRVQILSSSPKTCLPHQIQLKFNISRKYLKISNGRFQLAGVTRLHWMSPLAASKEFNKADLWRCGDQAASSRSAFSSLSFCLLRWNNKYMERATQRLTFYALW